MYKMSISVAFYMCLVEGRHFQIPNLGQCRDRMSGSESEAFHFQKRSVLYISIFAPGCPELENPRYS